MFVAYVYLYDFQVEDKPYLYQWDNPKVQSQYYLVEKSGFVITIYLSNILELLFRYKIGL